MDIKHFQDAKRYFTLTNTKKKKKACNLCFVRFQILIDSYKFIINNLENNLKFITQKSTKFIDELVPKHLQPELFAGFEDEITNLKKQWEEAKIKSKEIVQNKIDANFYSKKYYKTMKGRCMSFLKLYNRKDSKKMILKDKKRVLFIDGVPVIMKFSEKKKQVVISKTYGSHSYTDYEISLMEQNKTTN